jgi:multiple sugar transport system permease protein
MSRRDCSDANTLPLPHSPSLPYSSVPPNLPWLQIRSISSRAINEASRLEGATEWQIFWRIGMPLMRTDLVTVALLCFVGAWNNFFLPLIVLNQDSLYPLTLELNVWNRVSSNAGGRPVYNLIALGSLISLLPLLIAFIVLGKYWRGGLTAGATKG